jgi:thiamine-monophosphate kinase
VVTGTIGDAALGLKLRHDSALAQQWKLDAAQRAHLLDRYLLPQPRLAAGEALRAHASAAMDVSDGLVGDLAKLCRVSGVSAEIDAAKVPLSPAAQLALSADPALIEPILTGGDDYEIICTMPPDRFASFKSAMGALSLRATDIGAVLTGEGPPTFRDISGKILSFARGSFSHF